ncbi:FtsK/SpoIIIE domain-containing protein [Actinoplanes couchii]|uniref:Cell division protein FtsK n=1 Tax=Actinoplanes couchii TaxID=403638 RepID=A0ABQ3X5T4_9ACTN|nr:FtsK/SpoIIIE domain-containing protein [Actinoplanes couchii]MDR6325420.1 hypothetical protein [Actinoplanes couchii]GID53877.1 cell division protein FtsK [Actinoplanes couchii]
MGSHRNALVAVIRQELAEARGTARAVLAAAESARGEAQNRRRLVRDAYATCLNQLATARETARQDIRQRFHGEADRLAGHLRGLASASASGAAGTSWRLWAPSDPEPGRPPGLLRIGTIDFDETEALPGLIPLLDRAHLHLSGPQSTLDEVITGLLLRALGSTRAGEVELTVYDPERLGETLAVFAPLGTRFVGPGGLGPLLDELVDRLCRDEDRDGWRIVVLLADPATVEEMTRAQRAQLDRIVRTGVGRGVHLVVRGMELTEHPSVERITVRDRIASCSSLDRLEVRLDPAPPPQRVAAFCREAADRLRQGPPPARLADLEPDRHWAESARDGLLAPIGDSTDGVLVELSLGDRSPHLLIGGPAGSGKTNLIYTWLGSLATRYGPGELAVHLLDFTPGDAFTRYVPGPRDPSWLPQLRLAGINLQHDREFGLAVLRHLDTPAAVRTVLVIDEFPVLFDGRDALADEATALLAELVRRERVHLVLSAQDGVQSLTGRPAVFDRFTTRIALPQARRVLAADNLAASLIPRFHTVVNGESGLAGANRIVRLPDAGDRTAWGATQRRLWRCRPAGCEEPRVFDGSVVPRLPAAFRSSGRVPAAAGTVPSAVLGERIEVTAQPARLGLQAEPGRNLAVLGNRSGEACDVLAAAALSLAAQGPAHFSVVCLEPEAEPAATRLVAELPAADWYDAADVHFEPPESDVPRYVIGYGLDAAGPRHRPALRALLTGGPQRRIHVLGWWRSVARLRDDLAGRFEPIGAWVALGVHGSELAPLHPRPGGPYWTPRPRRALFFDSAVHRTPEVIIPYEVNSDHT